MEIVVHAWLDTAQHPYSVCSPLIACGIHFAYLILCSDGLVYFIVAFTAKYALFHPFHFDAVLIDLNYSLIQSIFVLVNLNPVLSITNCMLAMTAGYAILLSANITTAHLTSLI